MYTYETRVGFSMVDKDKNMTMNSIIDLFQNAATFHSEDIGMGYDYLLPNNLLWVVNTWQIDIIKYPKYLDRIKITTIPYKFRGFLGYRNFYVENEAGEVLIKADSMWSLIDLEKMKPTLIPEKMTDTYGPGESIEMEYKTGKILIPDNPVEKEKIKVEAYFLDPNHHMNNGQSIDIALSYLPEDYQIKRLRAEYRKQAFLGDMLCPIIGQLKTGEWVVSINDETGKPYSVIEVE